VLFLTENHAIKVYEGMEV